jgi:hypothetical protein
MASATAVRSLAGSCAQTCGLFTLCMVSPPDFGYSLKGRNQFGNASRSQDGSFRAWLWREIGAAERNVSNLIGAELDLAMTDVAWQTSQSSQLQHPAKQRMARIVNGDFAFAHLRDQGCITLAGFCRFRSGQ